MALSETSAPATEIFAAYFPLDYSDSQKSKFEKDMETLKTAFQEIPGFKGAAAGWSIEEVPYEKAEGGKAKVCVVLLGWESVDAHKQGTQTKPFKDNIHLLAEAGYIGTSMTHINATTVSGGGLGPEERGAIGGGAADAQEEILNPQDPGPGAPKSRADGTTTKNSTP